MSMKIEAVFTNARNTHPAAARVLLIMGGTERTVRENVILHQLLFRFLSERIGEHTLRIAPGHLNKTLHELTRRSAREPHMDLP